MTFCCLVLVLSVCVCVGFAVIVAVDATAVIQSSSGSSSLSVCAECPLLLFKIQVTNSKQLLNLFFIWCEFFLLLLLRYTQYNCTATDHVVHTLKKITLSLPSLNLFTCQSVAECVLSSIGICVFWRFIKQSLNRYTHILLDIQV